VGSGALLGKPNGLGRAASWLYDVMHE